MRTGLAGALAALACVLWLAGANAAFLPDTDAISPGLVRLASPDPSDEETPSERSDCTLQDAVCHAGMLRATRPGRMREPELRAAVAPVLRRSPGRACAIVARRLRRSGPDRRPVDRMARRDARSRRRRTRASLRHADPRKDRLRGRAARRGACLVRCDPGQPARRRKHRRAAAGARCRPHTTSSSDPAQQQRRGPHQIEIDPAAPQERDADQSVDDDRDRADRRQHGGGMHADGRGRQGERAGDVGPGEAARQIGMTTGTSIRPAPCALAIRNDQSARPARPVCMPTRTRVAMAVDARARAPSRSARRRQARVSIACVEHGAERQRRGEHQRRPRAHGRARSAPATAARRAGCRGAARARPRTASPSPG